jgi:hypothetical protein
LIDQKVAFAPSLAADAQRLLRERIAGIRRI